MNIGIIGAGSWGTAISIVLASKDYDIKIWDRDSELIADMRLRGENKKYLPGVIMPNNITPVDTIDECVNARDVIVMAVPSHAVRNVCEAIKKLINRELVIVNLAKGIENGSHKRISEVIEEFYPNNRIAVLSGPSHAEEVSKDIPTTVVASAKTKETAEFVQDVFSTPKFRIYTNPDMIGVELGGAVKNIIALAAGITDGLGYGDNTKAALMTRGITEITRLGVALGAQPLTFAGLSGIGDLIVTCTSMHSRNRRAGILIGQGKSIDEAIKEVKMVVEGINTTKSTYELSKKIGIEMPITNELYLTLFEGKDPRTAVNDLMLRDQKHEIEEVAKKIW
jgi:glycerol-3-phosphate dehydrogenase (NAD(P)+)